MRRVGTDGWEGGQHRKWKKIDLVKPKCKTLMRGSEMSLKEKKRKKRKVEKNDKKDPKGVACDIEWLTH